MYDIVYSTLGVGQTGAARQDDCDFTVTIHVPGKAQFQNVKNKPSMCVMLKAAGTACLADAV
jgi:hypothetical protein